MKYFSYNVLLRYVNSVFRFRTFFSRKRSGKVGSERKNIEGCIEAAQPTTQESNNDSGDTLTESQKDLRSILGRKYETSAGWLTRGQIIRHTMRKGPLVVNYNKFKPS